MSNGQSTVQLYQNSYLWDFSNVKDFLQTNNIQQPKFNRELLTRYLS